MLLEVISSFRGTSNLFCRVYISTIILDLLVLVLDGIKEKQKPNCKRLYIALGIIFIKEFDMI